MAFSGISESRDVLANRDFRLVLLANAFVAGSSVRQMTLSWLVLQETGSSVWVGAIAASVPAGIFSLSLLGGVMADRSSKRKVLVSAKIAMAGLAPLTAALISLDLVEMWHLLVIGVFVGFAFAFNNPAGNTIVLDVVGKDRMMIAVTLNQGLIRFTNIAAPVVAGAYLSVFGLNTIFYALTAVYLVAAAANWRLSGELDRSGGIRSQKGRLAALPEIRQGIGYVWATSHLRWMWVIVSLSLFAGAYPAVLPVLVRDGLGVAEDRQTVVFGILLASSGIGGAIGLVALSLIGSVDAKGRLLLFATMLMATGLVVVGLATNVTMAFTGALVLGFAGALFGTAVATLLQVSVEDDLRGRVNSVFGLAWELRLVGLLLGGLITALIGPGATLVLFGVLFGSIALLGFARSPELRSLS